jgi:hypothetical protein
MYHFLITGHVSADYSLAPMPLIGADGNGRDHAADGALARALRDHTRLEATVSSA